MIDFTNCRIVPGRVYNGANGSKIAVEYDQEVYMLKFPPSGVKKPTELSYTNSCISEHIASSVFNLLGIQAQETMLGTFTVKGKTKVVCACKDFSISGKRLFDFCAIKNTIIDSDSNGSGTEMEDIMDTIDRQQYVTPQVLREHFWNVFVVDALLGNFDRHNGNWGFLYDDNKNEAEIAPIYDCGSCLLPQADEKVMQKVISNEAELHARIYQFPTSAMKQNGRKINYYDFISRTENGDCNEALKRIVPRINMKEIEELVDSTPYITDLQKEFYKLYIQKRYELIIRPAYELVIVGKE